MSKLDWILDYKKENPGCDPNLYELVTISDEMAETLRADAPDYGIHTKPEVYLKDADGNPTELAEKLRKYKEIYNINMEALLNNDLGITKDSPLYKMMIKVSCNQNTYSCSPEYYSKLAGVALYIAQERRAVSKGEKAEICYNNKEEIEYLRNKLSPVYSRLLHEGKLRDSDLFPEIEVYNDVFREYIKSAPTAEHDYNLLSSDWSIHFKLEKQEREQKNSFMENLKSQVNGDDTLNEISDKSNPIDKNLDEI